MSRHPLDPARTTPIGLARYSEEFLHSSITVEAVLGPKFGNGRVPITPSLYLLGHSIELAFKAYLLHKEVGLNILKDKYGHDLIKCNKKALELGLGSLFRPTSAEEGAFELLNTLYSSKQLEYIVTGTKYMPLFVLIQSFASNLLTAVSSEIGYTLLED